MVYCPKCGTENEDGALYCVNCGASLKEPSKEVRGWEEELELRAEQFGERAEEFGKRMESECFGLPYGNSIIWVLIGIAIILVGMRGLLNWRINIMPFAAIVVGILIIAGVIFGQGQGRS